MNILLVDAYPLFRQGLRALLESGTDGSRQSSNINHQPAQRFAQDIKIAEAASVGQARQSLSVDSFDLILTDLHLDDTHGVDSLICLNRFARRHPIVVLSDIDDQTTIEQCMANGATGFLSKKSSLEELLAAIIQVGKGLRLAPAMVSKEASGGERPEQVVPSSEPGSSILVHLSKRQREVLGLLLQGKPNKTISSHMDISQNTVKAHLAAIFKVLGARNRTEVVYFAARAGLPLE